SLRRHPPSPALHRVSARSRHRRARSRVRRGLFHPERRGGGGPGWPALSRQARRRALDQHRLRPLVHEHQRSAGAVARDVLSATTERKRVPLHGRMGAEGQGTGRIARPAESRVKPAFTIAALLLVAVIPAAAAHWPSGAVIRVWIDPERAPSGGDGLVERAMQTWTHAGQGRFRLERAAARDQAVVRVRFFARDWRFGMTQTRPDPRTGLLT